VKLIKEEIITEVGDFKQTVIKYYEDEEKQSLSELEALVKVKEKLLNRRLSL